MWGICGCLCTVLFNTIVAGICIFAVHGDIGLTPGSSVGIVVAPGYSLGNWWRRQQIAWRPQQCLYANSIRAGEIMPFRTHACARAVFARETSGPANQECGGARLIRWETGQAMCLTRVNPCCCLAWGLSSTGTAARGAPPGPRVRERSPVCYLRRTGRNHWATST